MKPILAIACASGLAISVASVSAQPATLVSFSWSTTGDTAAGAGVWCDAPCVPASYTDPSSPAFSGGATAMTFATGRYEGHSARAAWCDCGGPNYGWSGEGTASSDYTIFDPSSSVSQVTWTYSDSLNIVATAAGSAVPGSASGSAYADNAWDLTFDTTGTTRLAFGRTHSVNVLNTGSAVSNITLVRVGGPTVYSQTFSRTSAGSDWVSGTPEFILPEGRYTLHIDQAISSSASTGTGAPGGGVQASFQFSVQLTPYQCAAITGQPSGADICRTGQATLSVGSVGTFRTYQWRRDGVNLADEDGYIWGSNGPNLSITNARAGDAGSYDCVVTNLCGGVTSDAAVVSVCIADYNCDGFVDGIDYDDFNNDFENTDPQQQMNADVNGDGFVDGIDSDEFNNQFENGC